MINHELNEEVSKFEQLLTASAKLHSHVCPRQVIGVRMGMLAGELLEMELPQKRKQLLTIVETDGCFADGVSAATNCWVGRRTMRVEDYGKIAATFIDTKTQRTIRIAPNLEARFHAAEYALEANNRWEAMLLGYQRMPIDELLVVQSVELQTPVESLISRAGHRVNCDICGEEIINEREVKQGEQTICRSCHGEGYYIRI